MLVPSAWVTAGAENVRKGLVMWWPRRCASDNGKAKKSWTKQHNTTATTTTTSTQSISLHAGQERQQRVWPTEHRRRVRRVLCGALHVTNDDARLGGHSHPSQNTMTPFTMQELGDAINQVKNKAPVQRWSSIPKWDSKTFVISVQKKNIKPSEESHLALILVVPWSLWESAGIRPSKSFISSKRFLDFWEG